jgi:hypothetical protein
VIYDDVNFIKQGWINRNRILLAGKPYIFSIQLSGASSFSKINQIKLGNNRTKIFKTIQQAYSKAPYYKKNIELIYNIFNYKTENLCEFVTNSIKEMCCFLNLNTEILISSHIREENLLKGEEKIIQICKLLKADTYVNAIGGQNLYSFKHFSEENVKLLFLRPSEIRYKQFTPEFIPSLSIIDVLMFNNLEEISRMLSQYDLLGTSKPLQS